MQDVGEGSTDQHGAFNFDLANLSYKVGLTVLKFIRRQARPLIRKEEQRKRLIAKRAAKAEQKSARASQKLKAQTSKTKLETLEQDQEPALNID